MTARSLLLGGGEKLAMRAQAPEGQARELHRGSPEDLAATIDSIREVRRLLQASPAAAKPGGEAVFEARLHPAFQEAPHLAVELLQRAGLREVGSRMAPLVAGGVALSLFVAGSEPSLHRWQALLAAGPHPARYAIAHAHWSTAEEKIKGPRPRDGKPHRFQAVLHAGANDANVLAAFRAFAQQLDLSLHPERCVRAGGLSFLPVMATAAQVRALAEFGFLRHARMAEALLAPPLPMPRRTLRKAGRPPQTLPPLCPDQRVAIFDAGLGAADLGPWAREHVYPETVATAQDFLVHGSEVSSAFLFGRTGADASLGRPVTGTDHYRVLAPDSFHDPDLFDVLLRIKAVLETGRHRFANISLGPRMPVRDDEVHVWTAVLEQLCERHDILLTVAAGNDGGADGAPRIQPPADMGNAVAVGACDGSGPLWQRAPYSGRGPGRAEQVKPDGLAFGGSRHELLELYSPLLGEVVGVSGTSYAAPLVLRTAASMAACAAEDLSALALKALLVHHAEPHPGQAHAEVGWGRFRDGGLDMLRCVPGCVTVLSRASIAAGECWRFPIPHQGGQALGISASFCAGLHMGPEHARQRAHPGLGISFRPLAGQGDMRSRPFFTADAGPERGMVLHRQRDFADGALAEPVFDIGYWAGVPAAHLPAGAAPVVDCVLVLSVQAPDAAGFYELIRAQHHKLRPIGIRPEAAASLV
ncbi:S8 family peptidase [Xylophilus sp. GW821-FHT01B05]